MFFLVFLHIKLGIVLKLYQILLSKTQQKDNIEASTARADQEESGTVRKKNF